MNPTDEQTLAYARSRIEFVEQQKGKRSILGFMGLGTIVCVILLIHMVEEKSEKLGGDLFMSEKFYAGIAMPILFMLVVGVAGLLTIQMFSSLYGRELRVYKLLVRLADDKSAG